MQRLPHPRGHHADDDIHPDLPARPGDSAIAKKDAADHEEQHHFFRPVERGVEEVAANDVCEIERNAHYQQHAGQGAENGDKTAYSAQYDVGHSQARV